MGTDGRTTYLQLSLNCLMMFEIFSNLCTSPCVCKVLLAITRNDARSNSTASSPPQVLQNVSSSVCNWPMFGIKLYTMDAQA